MPENDEKISLNEFKMDVVRSDVDFETALDHTGFGRFNIMLILTCGTSLFAMNNEGYSIGYILPSAECDLHLTTSMKSILTSSNFIGILASCCIWGYFSDTKGRKNILAITFLLSFLTSATSALMPSFWPFTILRFLNGIFISGPAAIVFAYFSEFHALRRRHTSMACVSLFIALAVIALPSTAWLLLPKPISVTLLGLHINSWRVFMLLSSVPTAIAAISFIFILPESPKYLYHSGDTKSALAVLRRMYEANTGRPFDTFPVLSLEKKTVDAGEHLGLFRVLAQQVVPLFRPPYWTYTVAGCLIQGVTFAVASGLLLWYPDIIKQLAGSRDRGFTVCEALNMLNKSRSGLDEEFCSNTVLDDQIFIQNIIIGFVYLVCYGLWGGIVKYLGNRNVIIGCLSVSAVALLSLLFLRSKMLIDGMFMVSLVLPGITSAMMSVELGGLVPTYLCGMVICLAMTAGRLGSVVSSSLVGFMLEWDCTTTFSLYGASLILAVLLLALVFPSSKNIHK